MNLKDLKYFVSVAEFKSFAKAANACFVSQPALSMQIKKFEITLGVQLFERNNKSVSITDEGIEILELAKQILNISKTLKETAKNQSNPFIGDLKLGIFPTLGPYLLPHIIPLLSQKLPKISFYLIEEKTEALLQKLNSGEIHAAILAKPIEDTRLFSPLLFKEAFLLAVPLKEAKTYKKLITKTAIDHEKLLLLTEGHCMKDQLVSFCNYVKPSNSPSYQGTSLEVLRHMVAAGSGITLMPKLSTQKCALLHYVPFKNPKPMREICLVYKNYSSKKILLKKIEQLIQDKMAKILIEDQS